MLTIEQHNHPRCCIDTADAEDRKLPSAGPRPTNSPHSENWILRERVSAEPRCAPQKQRTGIRAGSSILLTSMNFPSLAHAHLVAFFQAAMLAAAAIRRSRTGKRPTQGVTIRADPLIAEATGRWQDVVNRICQRCNSEVKLRSSIQARSPRGLM